MAAIELDLDLSDMPDLIAPEVPIVGFRLNTPSPSPVEDSAEPLTEPLAQPLAQPIAKPAPSPVNPSPIAPGFRPTWEEPTLRRRHRYRVPSFDWSDAIENELNRFSPQQYMQYTFEVTVLLTFMFPRITLIPASVLMIQRCVTLVRQFASEGALTKEERIPAYAVASLSLVINIFYMSHILGIV